MRPARDPVLLSCSALVLIVAAFGVSSAIGWVGRPFPGFLLLGNRVVASAGLQQWPAVRDGHIYQSEVRAVDGREISSASEVHSYVASKPVGSSIAYTLRSGGRERIVRVDTRRFGPSDFVLLFGTYILVGVGLCLVALAIRYLRPNDPIAAGSAISLLIIGLWGLSATDLYGPHRMFRLHAALECFLFAGILHLASVFPYRREALDRFPWLVRALYASAACLALACELGLYQPDAYVRVHRVAVGAFALSLVVLVAAELDAYLRPPTFKARQRVKILALGTAAAGLPGFVLLAGSTISGGQAPENLMGWGGIFFPAAIGYAVLKDDLLEVDEIVRRSLNWAILTGAVALGYAGIVAALDAMFQEVSSVTRWLSVAAFAGLSTGLLLPMRDKLQAIVDKTFYRSTYDLRRLLEESSGRFASLSSRPHVIGFVRRLVTETLQPSWIEVTSRNLSQESLDLEEYLRRLAVLHSTAPQWENLDEPILEVGNGALVVPFSVGRRKVGMLALGQRRSGRSYSGEDRRLLQTLANQAAVALENALALEQVQSLNRTLESRVRDRTADLEHALRELKDAEVHLVQAERLAAVGELSAGVAHEVNNPLNFARNSLATLRTYVDDVREVAQRVAVLDASDPEALARQLGELDRKKEELRFDGLAEDLGELVRIVTEGLDRTARLVADLRDFAAPGRGQWGPVDVGEGLRSTLQLLGHRMRQAGCNVETDLAEGLPRVQGDSGALNQVFLNLLKNAAEVIETTGTGTVRVGVSQEGAQLVVRVQDDGPGMDSEVKSRLFEPFFTTKEAGEGTGLGLSMCRRIVVEHGGVIEVESEPGQGTTMTVRLPIAPAASTPASAGGGGD